MGIHRVIAVHQQSALGQPPVPGEWTFEVIVGLRGADRIEKLSFLRPPLLLWFGRRLDVPAVVSFEKDASKSPAAMASASIASGSRLGS